MRTKNPFKQLLNDDPKFLNVLLTAAMLFTLLTTQVMTDKWVFGP